MDGILPVEIWSLILGEFCDLQQFALMELCSKAYFRKSNLWGCFRRLKFDGFHNIREFRWLNSKAPLELMENLETVGLGSPEELNATIVHRIQWARVKNLVMLGCQDLVPIILERVNLKAMECLEICKADKAPAEFIPTQMMPSLRILRLDTNLPAKDIMESVVSFCPAVNRLVLFHAVVEDSPPAVALARHLLQRPQLHILQIEDITVKLRSQLSPQETAKVLVRTGPLCLAPNVEPSPSSLKAFYEHALSFDAISSGAGSRLLLSLGKDLNQLQVAALSSTLKDPEVIAILKAQMYGKFLPVHYPVLLLHLIELFMAATTKKLKAPALDLIKYLLQLSNRPLNHLVHSLSIDLSVFGPFLTRLVTGKVELDVDLTEFLCPQIHPRWRPNYIGLHCFLQYEERVPSDTWGMHLVEHAAYFRQLSVVKALVNRTESDAALRKAIYQPYTVLDTLRWIDNIKRGMIPSKERTAYKAIIRHIVAQSKVEGIPHLDEVNWFGMVAPFFGKRDFSLW